MPELVLTEPDPVKLYAALKEAMVELRGFDLVPGKKISARIPRTTNADVRLLLTQWTAEVAKAGIAASSNQKTAWEKLVGKWTPAAAEMQTDATDDEPSEVFDDNVRFWTATGKLAISLNSIKAIPSTWELALEATAEAAREAPAVVLDVTKKVGGAVVDVTSKIASGAGRVVGSAGKGFLAGLGVGGIALIAGAAYLYTQRKRRT